jgi:hypothetical protein
MIFAPFPEEGSVVADRVALLVEEGNLALGRVALPAARDPPRERHGALHPFHGAVFRLYRSVSKPHATFCFEQVAL